MFADDSRVDERPAAMAGNTTDRRRFLKYLAAASGTAIGARCAGYPAPGLLFAGDEEGAVPPMQIIDTHQHLWDLDRFRLPWTKGNERLARNFSMADYLDATRGLNVVKTIYMEVDLDPAQQDAEAEYVIETCRRDDNPMVAGVISGRPASPGFASYIKKYAKNPYIKGVRQILHPPERPAGYCLDEQFIEGIRLLGELDMSFDICIRPGELVDAVKLVDACPQTRFILDHCGNADVQAADLSTWRRGMEQLAKRSRVVAKISGIVVTAKPDTWSADDLAPVINHTLDVFGPDRVMFGGDWPVCTLKATYRQWVEALQAIVSERADQEQRKLFHDNAVKIYRLG